jgi:hypothetical protein
MNNLESLVSDFTSQITAQVRQSVLAELRHMSLDQLFALAGGKAPKAGPAAFAAPAPAKRGPGRPRKNAAPAAKAAAPKAAKAPKAAASKAPKAKKTSTGRLARRSVDDIQGTLSQIVAFVQANPGVRSEHITASLGLDKKELPRPIAEGLRTGALSKQGQKRATQYFAGKKGRKG